MAEQEYLGPAAQRFSDPKDCPVEGCKHRFIVVRSYYNHMWLAHELDNDAVAALPLKSLDKYPSTGAMCSKCEGAKRRFARRSHLLARVAALQ